MPPGPAHLVPQAPKGDAVLQCQVRGCPPWCRLDIPAGIPNTVPTPTKGDQHTNGCSPFLPPPPPWPLSPVHPLPPTTTIWGARSRDEEPPPSCHSISHVGPISEGSPASSRNGKSPEKILPATKQEETR